MDVKISSGDVVTDACGNFVYVNGNKEMLQRAVICISTVRGSFIYNKELGCEPMDSVSTERDIRRLEARMREAVSPLFGVMLSVTGVRSEGDSVYAEVELAYKDEIIRTEVII